jgi:hypothetical protein
MPAYTASSYANELIPKITGYSDGVWYDHYSFYPLFYDANAGYWFDWRIWNIKSLDKYRVVLESTYFADEGTDEEWAAYEIHITQSPFANIKLTDWHLTADVRVIMQTRAGLVAATTGQNHSPRFTCITLDTIQDGLLNNDTTGDETEGLSIAFGTQNNLLALFYNQDNTDWRTYVVTDVASTIFNITAIDFDADTPPHWWGIGLMPFDTSLLNSNGWDDSSLTGVEAGYITINDYPAGSYRAWVYATGASGDEDATFIITGAVGTSGTFTWTNISSSGEWSDPVDFIAEDLDDITYTVTRTGGTGAITLGELVITPITNSKNFPLDERNHALRLLNIQEMIE